MAVDTGDDRTDRRQVDVIVGVDVGLVGRTERVRAMRTGMEQGRDDRIGVFGQCTDHAGAAEPRRLFAGVGPVGLLPFRGRQAGVVWGLGWGPELGLQFGDTRAQSADLLRLRFDLRLLGQDQADQVIAGELDEGGAVHASP
jgi:hypothetical protein